MLLNTFEIDVTFIENNINFVLNMDAKFSPRVKDVISYSREEALRLGHDYIGVEHLLLGMLYIFLFGLLKHLAKIFINN